MANNRAARKCYSSFWAPHFGGHLWWLWIHFSQSSLTVGVPVFKTHLPGANDIVQSLGADRDYCFCFLTNMLFASLLMSITYLGAENVQIGFGIPRATTSIFQGALLLYLLATDFFINFEIRIARAQPE